MTGRPVAVLMPAKDGRFLHEAVPTMLGQSFGDFDMIVVDDGLDAAPRAYLDATAQSDPRLRVIAHRGAPGLAAVLNTGLDAITAPLVARADADDRYAPDRLARQLPHFARRPDLVALSCGYVRIRADGTPDHTFVPVTGSEVIRFRALFSNSILHPGVIFRRAAVAAVDGYDPAFWTAQDSDLWARLMDRGGVIDNIAEPLVEWREHAGSVLATRGAAGRQVRMRVSRRLQSAYLGRDCALEDVAAGVDAWRSTAPLSADTLRRGTAQLARIFDVARGRETAAVLRDFRARMTGAFQRQIRFCLRRNPALLPALGRQAAIWRFGTPAGYGRR